MNRLLISRGTFGTFSLASIEKLPSGKYRSVVRHAGAKRASVAVESAAVAKTLEATLKLSMGGSPAPRERHTVGGGLGYIADGAGRLSPGSIDFYRKGLAALPESFSGRPVGEVTPLVLDSLYAELRAGGAEWSDFSGRRLTFRRRSSSPRVA